MPSSSASTRSPGAIVVPEITMGSLLATTRIRAVVERTGSSRVRREAELPDPRCVQDTSVGDYTRCPSAHGRGTEQLAPEGRAITVGGRDHHDGSRRQPVDEVDHVVIGAIRRSVCRRRRKLERRRTPSGLRTDGNRADPRPEQVDVWMAGGGMQVGPSASRRYPRRAARSRRLAGRPRPRLGRRRSGHRRTTRRAGRCLRHQRR